MSNLSPLAFIILVTTLAGVMTNIVSNNITISVLTNLGIALALTSGVSPALVTVLIVCIANYAFATPAATLQMTMVAGSGWVDTTKMIKYGVATMIIGIIVMIAVAIPIARMLF
jgi:di/tricarboxylate transporter